MSNNTGSREKIEQVIKAMARNNINGFYAANREEARVKALSFIFPRALIGLGNSLTLRQTEIYQTLVQGGDYKLIDQFEEGISKEENLKRRKLSLTVDLYFTGTNAVTMDGKIVNVDGKGNRVAAIMYGPDKVVLVAGRNKIVPDEKAAWDRIQYYTAPHLAASFGRDTPCAKTIECSDCRAAERICRYYTLIGSLMPADKERMNVILVDEDLGI